MAETMENEIRRRREERLHASLTHPHPETVLIAGAGLAEWGLRLTDEGGPLVDPHAGRAVKWSEEGGWVKS